MKNFITAAIIAASTFAASADEVDELKCHQWAMVAAAIVEHRDAGTPITTLFEAFPTESGIGDLIASIYKNKPTAAAAYSTLKEICKKDGENP